MKINGILWRKRFIEKIIFKHHVLPVEVDELFKGRVKYLFAKKGKFKGEDKYFAYGKTFGGRYLLVVFIYKKSKEALIVTARDMTKNERKLYDKK